MREIITLPCSRELEPIQSDVNCRHEDKQIWFKYIGIHNSPLPTYFPLIQTSCNFERSATVIGDGYQMLAQTGGTVDQPIDIGRCPDNDASYRIYPQNAAKRYYNYLVLEESNGYTLFGFTSCQRFAGFFEIIEGENGLEIIASIDGEGSQPQTWENNNLESITILTGSSLAELYTEYGELIAQHHKPRLGVNQKAPVGWCSWYAYYAEVTEQNIQLNVDHMKGDLDNLEWVLLDDGYQAFMGDWLTPSDKFTNGVKELIQSIKEKGKKPAIWMAPFIAQPESEVFRNHPNWFVKDEQGNLLKAEDVTYGGWRCTPWYILDTSHPEVKAHLTHIVKTMREEWGVELFKLDANYWGTLKGKRYQPGVTGVQAYRMGMEAIAKGAGDAWLLGCNAPMWPSLGLVDAMRVSDDVERHPHRFEQIAKETFYRSWQHRKLWQIDPDCVTLTSLPNQTTDRKSYNFHRDVCLASGGLLLSGDPLPELTPYAQRSLSKLIIRHKHSQQAAEFSSLSLNHAVLNLTEHNHLHCLFNYHGDEKEFTLASDHPVHWYHYWTGEKLSEQPTQIFQFTLPAGLTSQAIVTAE
ncbi:glycosyl hydrolase [Vibrio sp. 03-59-1]|uniref:glycoside hydrolase family 36 protein n=1 Tax=Vibrio sp. 03-59-1 TaxID=2607607 RepID=UPI001493AE1A|nr:alpha-galactosidase [Vibrio sp. 03-59-1]NOH83191.1 glycosyl hydrolase [Vibrio sp. 03-59-1]